ncbi:endo alpha-1,4 polygalactosaminidase [Streptomyces sp. URMC 123]|uniref:endo alpha-1,4 polygalactosaminidase n=1 Tax=Streptomyces sp. URMC 123 TaxID=3423403 RepID=UPI003F1B2627
MIERAGHRAGPLSRLTGLALALLLLPVLSVAGCTRAGPDGPDGPNGPPGGAGGPARVDGGAGPGTGAGAPAGRWRPRPGTPWQWQLSGRVDTGVDVPVYDIDGFENDADTVRRLHAAGRKVICYVNAGAWESFRPDRDAFPPTVLGRGNGWEGERWLDIRRLDVLRPLMARRLDMCRAKGFDAVEPDLLDAYAHRTGFPLTARHQLAYNRVIADLAHRRGLAVGLKNDLGQIPELVADFDFAVNEECARYGECAALTPFVAAGKAVFHVEYAEEPAQFCPTARRLGLSSMRKRLALDAWRHPCERHASPPGTEGAEEKDSPPGA